MTVKATKMKPPHVEGQGDLLWDKVILSILDWVPSLVPTSHKVTFQEFIEATDAWYADWRRRAIEANTGAGDTPGFEELPDNVVPIRPPEPTLAELIDQLDW